MLAPGRHTCARAPRDIVVLRLFAAVVAVAHARVRCVELPQSGSISMWRAAPAFVYYALRPSVAEERCAMLLQQADVGFIKSVWRLLDSCACHRTPTTL